MNKTIALNEFNKRASVQLNAKEFDLIEGMKSFDEEKVLNAFIALTGREITADDIKLAILIIDLSAALTPPVTLIRDPSLGGSPFNWPRSNETAPYRQTYGGDVLLGGGRGMTQSFTAVDDPVTH
jgi:hypothetical protein